MALYTLVIHGGAGTILKKDMTPESEDAYRKGLEAALNAGYSLLEKNGSAVDAVRGAVMTLENNILFNAGRGSVFTATGIHEMDAGIMDGRSLQAGAVTAVSNIRNPVALAYHVMKSGKHVFLSGKGAEEFARENKIAFEPDEYFYSAFRHAQWRQAKMNNEVALDHNIRTEGKKFGTVGAVACDADGNIAAATSTGGMSNKAWGRIGDSPVIGAGFYANNKTCAISCTGNGEAFLRSVAAYDVSCLMEYKGMNLQEAMHMVVHDKLLRTEGEGGMIGVDTKGNSAMVFNSDGMYRGMKSSNGKFLTEIYK